MENKKIDKFFEDYENNFNKGLSGKDTDINEDVVNSFADCFIESSPVGVICGKNDESFPQRVREGFDFYRSIGTQAMNILSKETTALDDFHSMVKVRWHYSAFKKDSSMVMIDFDTIYFLRIINDDIRIFAYIAGDEQKSLKENGLLPEK
jgi:hypothetical protein